MGFIKHALIGIALYEAVRYMLKQGEPAFNLAVEGEQVADGQPLRSAKKDNPRAESDLEIPQINKSPKEDEHELWKNSLADDELRAPDS